MDDRPILYLLLTHVRDGSGEPSFEISHDLEEITGLAVEAAPYRKVAVYEIYSDGTRKRIAGEAFKTFNGIEVNDGS